jgi:RND superfamily putative drug exporter
MFHRLGNLVSRHWAVVLLAWVCLVAGLPWVAPRWEDVTLDGDFAYLPARMTSVRGEKLLERAFPEQLARSSVALVFARRGGALKEADYRAIDGWVERYTPKPGQSSPVVGVWSYQTEVLGRRLTSRVAENGQASLVFLHLASEFTAVGNMRFMTGLYRDRQRTVADANWPAGLELGVTGSAAIGADMLFSAQESIDRTEKVTVLLVMMILLAVYRSPGLVVIPLATIMASVSVARNLVAGLALASDRLGWLDFHIFKTTQIFVVVILYGAGTDFCLFLISRYREELQQGYKPERAIARALGQVGSALAASALTTILGLGTMVFADFGKFRNGGPAIALCLAVALLASITLAPALLRAVGVLVFWPWRPAPKPGRSDAAGTIELTGKPFQNFGPLTPGPSPARGEGSNKTAFEPQSRNLSARLWPAVAQGVLARPGLVLVVSALALAPLAWRGRSVAVSYDLVNELSPSRPSVSGFRLLQDYFLPGEIGPVTVLARRSDGRFQLPEGQAEISRLTKYLYQLTVPDAEGIPQRPILRVRSLMEPLGGAPGAYNPFTGAGRDKLLALKNPRSKALYLSPSGPLAGQVTRFDLVFDYDSFSRESVELFNHVERQLRALTGDRLLAELGRRLAETDRDFAALQGTFPEADRRRLAEMPAQLTYGDVEQFLALARLAPAWHGAEMDFLGNTPGIRDLEQVTSRDQSLIRVLVVLMVGGVLIVILGRPGLCAYLILSVLFSYLVTMGITEWLFGWYYGATYRGLDWKVPLFLFVLLVAVGQDYNIYLVTRVLEEQRRLGSREGLRRAMIATGGIITSCGVIMAGTFVSMLVSTLRGMQELGLALSLGILLDTLVIRTVLVPAFMALGRRSAEREVGNER